MNSTSPLLESLVEKKTSFLSVYNYLPLFFIMKLICKNISYDINLFMVESGTYLNVRIDFFINIFYIY